MNDKITYSGSFEVYREPETYCKLHGVQIQTLRVLTMSDGTVELQKYCPNCKYMDKLAREHLLAQLGLPDEFGG